MATLHVGKHPQGLAVDPLKTEKNPYALAVGPSGGLIYGVLEEPTAIEVIDPTKL